jgi:O-antigen/teichoic acid export membrane protein
MSFTVFYKNFIARKGIFVGVSSLIEKVGGFCLIFIATKILSKSEFGFITYANTTLVFLIPFVGFGIHQGLIRYGAITDSQKEKKELFLFSFKKGLVYSLFLMLIVVLLVPFIAINLKEASIYIYILSFQLIGLFVFEMLRIYTRLIHLNRLYAQITNVKTISLVILSLLLTINFNSIGYAISLAAVPFLVALVYLKKLKLLQLFNSYKPIIDFKSFFLYGFYTSISGVLSQLLYAVDIILLGNILIDESAVALYKISNIFPFSLLILPLIFMNTDFVKIANKSTTDKNYVKIYYLNYLKLFLLIGLGVFFTFYFFSDKLLSFFGKEYEDSSLMTIFSIGVIGALLLRIPLGNILSAVGMVKINAINSLIILLLNLIFSYIFIQDRGTQGAAIVTACLMWFSGFLSLIYFIWFLKKEK